MDSQALRDFNGNDMEGFDLEAGKSWIYPTNYSLRDYQYNIVSESLYKNTLVSLPTGLGKTFIAAVVMFNFYRWYPSGKIIFMAPTKPLVKQQIDACYNIMAIPKEKTVELTGTKMQTSRIDLWMSKRVFFITPQVLQNDLNSIPDLSKQIRCIVIDEAHKAKGNYAYCEVIRQIVGSNKHFRVLALSATPGSTINDVSEIIKNLLISHLEFRTEDSPDVMPFVFQRTMETIVVPLGHKLQTVKAAYLQILEKYTRILVENRVIPGNNCANLTKGRMFMLMKDFQEKNKHNKVKAYGDIMRNLNLCITLYHGYELLIRHGLRGFLNYFEEHSEKALLRGNEHLHRIMMDVQEYLGPKPCTDILPDGTMPNMSPQTKFGHPKFYKLQDILLTYFSQPNNTSSKVIIFTEYRDSVMEIYTLLIQHMPIIKPKYFLGQSSITQKQQVTALKSFRSGEYNTLISTCIGEEGLDIGEVDLIICFDISNKSPIRLVQRMGRTGRKKEGKIIILVTEGKEEEILKECMVNKHYLSKNILKSRELHLNLYQHNPRMVPETVMPICQKIHISIPNTTKTKSGNLKSMLNNMIDKSLSSQEFSDIQIIEMHDRISEMNMVWDKGTYERNTEDNIDKIVFSKHLESLRVQQQINTIGHSSNCHILTSLLQYADSKRYNIPITQKNSNEIISKKSKFGKHDSFDSYKQSDIRTMFLKSQTVPSQSPPKNNVENITNLIIEDNLNNQHNELLNELHNEISTNISLSCIEEVNCKICANLFTCYRTTKFDSNLRLDEWIQPNFSVVEEMTLSNILSFKYSLKPVADIFSNTDLELFDDFIKDDWDNLDQSFKSTNDKSHFFSFEPPKSVKKVLNTSNISSDENIKYSSNNENVSKKINFKYEEALNKQRVLQHDDVLSFFKISEISSLFDIEGDKVQGNMNQPNEMDKSPSLLTFSQQENKFNNSLGFRTFTQTKLENNNVSRNLFAQNEKCLKVNKNSTQEQLNIRTSGNKLNENKPKLSNLANIRKSNFFKSKANSVAPQLKQCSNSDPVNVIVDANSSKDCINELFTNVSDFCDLSLFGLQSPGIPKADDLKNSLKEDLQVTLNIADISNSDSDDLFGSCTNSPQKVENAIVDVKDICDLNVFGIFSEKEKLSLEDEKLLKNDNVQDEENISPLLTGHLQKNILGTSNKKPKECGENQNLAMSSHDQNEDGLSPLLTGKSRRKLFEISKEKESIEDEKLTESSNDQNEADLSPVLTGSSKRNLYIYNRKEETNEKDICSKSFIDTQKLISQRVSDLTAHDICDVSIFGIENTDFVPKSANDSFTNSFNQNQQGMCSLKLCHDSIDTLSASTSQNRKPTEDVSQISVTQIINIINKDINVNKNNVNNEKINKLPQTLTPKDKKETHVRKLYSEDKTNYCISPILNNEICVKEHKDLSSRTSLKQEQTSAKKKFNFTKRKRPVSSSKYDSEDEFEDSSIKSTGWIRPAKKTQCSPVRTVNVTPEKAKHKKKKKKTTNPFIDNEAVLDSSDEVAFQDSHSEGGSSEDDFETSFVNDQTLNTTDIHGKYLQTTKSPIRNKGVFKIPQQLPPRANIFSQEENYGDDSYLNDTFCVDDDDDSATLTQNKNDLSELEIAELILEAERKKKSTKRCTKLRTKVFVSSDSE